MSRAATSRTKPTCPECAGRGAITLPVMGDTMCPLCLGAGTYDPANVEHVANALRRTWGSNVRRARLAMGLEQAELAERVGISQSAVSMVEAGTNGFRDTTKLRLAQALGVPPRVLFPWRIGKSNVMEP
jgi:DNA-binding XRE family transcriptional regulator